MRKPKTGGKQTLRLFLKGNEDLSDSLLGRPEEHQVGAHALQDLVREKYQGAFTIELIHEPSTCSAVLLQQVEGTVVPKELGERDWGVNRELITAQFQSRLFEAPADVVVFSIQPEIAQIPWRHRRSGYLLCPPPCWDQDWPPTLIAWFTENLVSLGLPSAEQFKVNLTRLIRMIKERLDAHVLIYNAPTVDPDDQVHNYYGRDDTRALRIHKLNLALLELSASEGISFVDVERLVAELGAARHVLPEGWYSQEANQAIRLELLRVLEDIGFYENRPLVMQVGKGS
jgi:hypothetical protein